MKFLLLYLCVGIVLAMECEYNGRKYRNGQTWVTRGFVIRCKATEFSWETMIVACRTRKGTKIPVNGIKTENGIKYRCYENKEGEVTLKASSL
ncbi:hypothetical protein TELCIR_17099 [Teladorsagia circumcincta]|uniref:Abnormal cell migration protein 18-like fibronectin type I domain-containing protein n=1 Tax=Teladorsagia circumcincta TaxID=45464 RepID=A0A2G9TTP4_TELCI|nr:hypothetical protein TELCIR_17099 [Teladorsagia circumcincta]